MLDVYTVFAKIESTLHYVSAVPGIFKICCLICLVFFFSRIAAVFASLCCLDQYTQSLHFWGTRCSDHKSNIQEACSSNLIWGGKENDLRDCPMGETGVTRHMERASCWSRREEQSWKAGEDGQWMVTTANPPSSPGWKLQYSSVFVACWLILFDLQRLHWQV